MILGEKKYECTFVGKTTGALGVSSWHKIVVEAPDERSAKLRCYNTHEHITGGVDGIRVKEITDGCE